MSTILGIDTAIGWAHWKVRGGWKNALWTVAGYTGVISALIFVSVRMDPPRMTNILAGWRVGLLLLEGGLLVLLAGTRVAMAVRSDINSRMIESHRLMPISPFVAVTGYLWGPPAQSVFLGAATFLIGLVVVMAGGISADVWIAPCVIIGAFAVFFWVVMVFLGSIIRAPAGVVVTIVFVSIATQGLVLLLLPGIVPLLVPFTQGSVFQPRGMSQVDWPILVGLAGEGWIGAAFFIGAARKYRRSEDSALGVLPAIILLAGWVVMSAVGMQWWDQFVPRYYADEVYRNFQMALMGSIWSSIVLAIIPLSNVARMRRCTFTLPFVALSCAAIIWLLVLVWTGEYRFVSRAYATTAVVLGSFLLSCGYLLRITHRYAVRSWVAMLLWIALIGTVPIIVDSVLWGFGDVTHDYSLTSIAAFSPGGAMVMGWSEDRASVIPGLSFQIAVTIWLGIMAWLLRRRRGRTEQGTAA